MEYCCHIWAGAPSCYLELLEKLQKRICRTVDPSLATSLEPMAYRRSVASLSLFYRYCFGRFSSELAQLVPLHFSGGRSTRYSDRLDDFSVTIPRCFKDVFINSFFPRTARLWNSLPVECFPLTYNLNGFKFRINWHLLINCRDFRYALTFLCFFSSSSFLCWNVKLLSFLFISLPWKLWNSAYWLILNIPWFIECWYC